MHIVLATSESPLGFLSDFGVKWELLISQGLSFAIVAAALYWFVFKPVSSVAEKRQAEIQKGLDDAKKAAQELKNAQTVADEKLNEAIVESAKMLKDARDEAKLTIERATQEASAKVAEIRQKSQDQLESDRNRIKQELRIELSEAVANATKQVLKDVLTDEQKAKLAEIAAKKLEL